MPSNFDRERTVCRWLWVAGAFCVLSLAHEHGANALDRVVVSSLCFLVSSAEGFASSVTFPPVCLTVLGAVVNAAARFFFRSLTALV